MKKIVLILIVLALIAGSCRVQKKSATHENGVVINGVKWATRNVDEFGTFAPRPESEGKFYQWNRKMAWNITDKTVDWDYSFPEGERWTETNDPSPTGWRMPTSDEIKTLLDTEKVKYKWVVQNGVSGGKFTDKKSGKSIFLPAVGYRFSCQRECLNNGKLILAGEYCLYWSSTAMYRGSGERYAYELNCSNHNVNCYDTNRNFGLSVRSVAK